MLETVVWRGSVGDDCRVVVEVSGGGVCMVSFDFGFDFGFG